MDRPKLLIVAPSWNDGWWGRGKVLAPPLVLPHLAGLTPKKYDIQLIDENVEKVDPNADTDFVVLSCMTASAPRGYEIADRFRERGIPVVIGGIHPTVMPEEAGLHADSVVIGEAELVWENVLSDFEASSLKPRYKANEYFHMRNMPFPRRDLLRKNRYLTIGVVQTARGCPNKCKFCSVSSIFGSRCRHRPISDVVEEIRTLNGCWVGFVDDNITGIPSRAKELFEALISLKIRWVGQGDLNMAKDPELLALAARSGCQAMFIGLESLSQENLRETNKWPNIGLDMGEAIRKIHKSGIEIIGSFVFGLDGDNTETFPITLKFAQDHGLGAAQFSLLTPYPGTETREQLVSAGRVTSNDWSQYTMSNIVFLPLKPMTVDELQKGQRYVYDRFYSYPSIFRRSLTFSKIWHRKVILTAGVGISYHRLSKKKGLAPGLPTKK